MFLGGLSRGSSKVYVILFLVLRCVGESGCGSPSSVCPIGLGGFCTAPLGMVLVCIVTCPLSFKRCPTSYVSSMALLLRVFLCLRGTLDISLNVVGLFFYK